MSEGDKRGRRCPSLDERVRSLDPYSQRRGSQSDESAFRWLSFVAVRTFEGAADAIDATLGQLTQIIGEGNDKVTARARRRRR